jgi:alpha-methylacyl-CoA racemase
MTGPEPPPGTMNPMGAFLTGVRVLDLSHYIPGPLATLHLADFGAEVIKVEPPGGDQMAALGPRDGVGAPIYYHALNAGKTLVTLNLKTDADRARFLDMVATADVVVEGFRPGVLARLGIDYEVLAGVNPGIILCSISGYGATGPDRARAGHDANYLAQSGVMHRNGRPAPMFFDPPLADMAGALYGLSIILAALHGRARSGRGCRIDLGLADTMMPLQLLQVADFGATGRFEGAGESYLNGGAAFYNVYACADGRHIVLGAVEAKFWTNFCAAAGRPDWLARQAEPIPQNGLIADLASYFAGLDSDAVLARFGGADCCLSRVDTLAEAMASDQVIARRIVRSCGNGRLQALFPVLIDGQPPRPRLPLAQLAPAEVPAPCPLPAADAAPPASAQPPVSPPSLQRKRRQD